VILLTSVLAGTITGLGIARWKGQAWHPPTFHSLWLVYLGFFPQFIAFYLPATRRLMPDGLASLCLVFSQILLLVFAGKNLHLPGMSVLMVGLGCNLIVILSNGGFMPLASETAARLVDHNVMNGLTVGSRLGKASKDILMPESQILLPWLADRFVSPQLSSSYRAVFSLGDVFIAAGVFWMLVKRQTALSLSLVPENFYGN
jgi:hypothetical protein